MNFHSGNILRYIFCIFKIIIIYILFTFNDLAFAQNKIGSVTAIEGSAISINTNDEERELNIFDSIYTNDEIFVSEDSTLTIQYLDNRNNLKKLLNINSKRNILDPEFWNYNLIVDNYSKNKSNNFERSFTNLFILTKNNKLKNSDLKVYFIKNYNLFSETSKKNILKNYKVN